MHKPASNEVVASLHDLSAVDLIAGFRAKQFSPTEVLEDVLAHIAVWEPHIKALYAFDPDGARAVAKASTERWQKGEPAGPLDGVPTTIKENIATQRRAGAAGCGDHQTRARRCRRAAGGALARSGCGDFFQNHHAGLRHAVVGAVELSSPHPQSMGPVEKSRRLQRRRGRGGCCGLRSAASRHRHRRLGAAAGVLVRPGCAEAEPRANSDRSALCRPRRRSHDPHRRRRGADDERAVKTRPPRRHEPAAERHQLESARSAAAQIADRADARPRRRTGAGEGSPRCGREGRARVRSRRRRGHRGAERADARDARRPRRVLARALVGRSFKAGAGRSRQGAALYLQMGGRRRKALRRRCGQGF